MEKQIFVNGLKSRTKKLAVDVVMFYNKIEKSETGRIIGKQLIRSVTSTSANYRAACVGRSKKEFFSKMAIVVEEADETYFWLELLKETKLAREIDLKPLLTESLEILKIMSKAKSTLYNNK
jgi:four helix bundle protein